MSSCETDLYIGVTVVRKYTLIWGRFNHECEYVVHDLRSSLVSMLHVREANPTNYKLWQILFSYICILLNVIVKNLFKQ
jgi:hypothetical protein